MTDHIEVMAETMWNAESFRVLGCPRLIAWADEGESAKNRWRSLATAARDAHLAAPLPAGGDGELVGWLRKFGPTAKTTTEQNLMDQAADRIAALNAEVARKDEALVAAQREITALKDALAQAGGSFDA